MSLNVSDYVGMRAREMSKVVQQKSLSFHYPTRAKKLAEKKLKDAMSRCALPNSAYMFQLRSKGTSLIDEIIRRWCLDNYPFL